MKYINLIDVGWDHHVAHRALASSQLLGRGPALRGPGHRPEQRGLLEDTLVTFKGEFGRTVYAQGGINPGIQAVTTTAATSPSGMAGGGTKPGIAYGAQRMISATTSSRSPWR